MQQSRLVSEFTVHNKDTPATLHRQSYNPLPQCSHCLQHLSTTTQLRKRQILLQLQNQQLKEKLSQTLRQKQALLQQKVLTYYEYQQKLQQDSSIAWNRQDIEAQLNQAKLVIQLLLLSKSSHPQIKTITDESLKQKYANLLLENLRLEEKVAARDRLIQEKSLFPLYHYDQRIATLRKAVAFWYRKAEQQCARMKNRCREMKIRVEEEGQALREQMLKELQNNKENVLRTLQMFKGKNEPNFITRKKTVKSIIQPQQKKRVPSTSYKNVEIKKLR